MLPDNPFSADYDTTKDAQLVERAVGGDRSALDALIRRHDDFVYNLALKVLGSPADAADASQEILIKIITRLSAYDAGRAQFRTWLYRIAFNFLLDYKKSRTEAQITSFGQFFDFIEAVPDSEAEVAAALTHETMVKCMTGMLMCVPREDRLLYVVGDLFKVEHKLGAELFDLSPANYRKRLSRIRQQLREWMNDRCGLVNKANPCRCAKKTRGFVDRGIVDPELLVWDKNFTHRIADFARTNTEEALRDSDRLVRELYQNHPFQQSPDAKLLLDRLLQNSSIKKIMEL